MLLIFLRSRSAFVLLLLIDGLAANAVQAEGVLAWASRLALVLGCLRCTLLIVCTLLLLAA